jgi:hypothetical protein
VGRWLTAFFSRILAFLDPVPDLVLGLALIALAAGVVTIALRGGREVPPPADSGGSCHEHHEDATENDAEHPPGEATCHEETVVAR